MKKTIKRTGIILLGTVLVLLIVLVVMFWNELRSLDSIRQADDYGMFQMTYYGDYGFDDFLKVGAESDTDIETFVTKRLLKGIPIKFNVIDGGCTAFVTHDDGGNVIFGRNFDFTYAPTMQLITRPKNGYASVSTVNLAFAGYSENNLPSGLNVRSFLSLAAPYLPFDGMNEKGVAIALLAVPQADLDNEKNKITLNTTTAIRLVLDNAATVDEAVELLTQYNVYFSGGIYCHYLIADASGRSVLAEYFDGKLQTVTAPDSYQIASNFIAYNGVNIGEGFTEFERYATVETAIKANGNHLNAEQAIQLLAKVGVMDNGMDKLQWSVVYNLTALNGTIFAHRNTDNLNRFQLTTYR